MRIGTLSYRTRTGLGYQVRSYIKHLPVTRNLVIDLSSFNHLPLTDWYADAHTVKGYPRPEDLDWLLQDIDVVLLAETPLNYELYRMARQRGIKTAVAINWEFFDHIAKPELPLPDLFIMPSMWHFEDAQAFAQSRNVKCVYIHHPVDREEFIFRERTGNTPLHIAGNPAAHDRNGTFMYMEAHPTGRVITQSEELARMLRYRYRFSTVYTNVQKAANMYEFGDFLVLPRRYGGNCMPLNEALSCGLPVIMPDISPNNHLLPPEWLVPATATDSFTPRTKVTLYSVDTNVLRDRIAYMQTRDMAVESCKADAIAQSISWEALKPKFMKELAAL